MTDPADIAERLAAISEELADLALDRLRQASDSVRAGGQPDPAAGGRGEADHPGPSGGGEGGRAVVGRWAVAGERARRRTLTLGAAPPPTDPGLSAELVEGVDQLAQPAVVDLVEPEDQPGQVQVVAGRPARAAGG